jgi:outer membrane usher protein
MDGIVYLENLKANNTVTVQRSDQSVCKADFSVDVEQAKQQIVVVKPVTCHEYLYHENKNKKLLSIYVCFLD